MENRVSEEVINIFLLEGLNHYTAGVNTKVYFTEIKSVVNNGIVPIENINWKLPVNMDTLSPVSLCNTSDRKLSKYIGILFDIIFRHHSDNNRRDKLYVFVLALY